MKLCCHCKWADITYGDQYCSIFCQVKMRNIYDITETCKHFEPKDEVKR